VKPPGKTLEVNMFKDTLKVLIAINAIWLYPLATNVFATPVVSSVTRTENQLTIVGSSFGVKPAAAPLRWETWNGASEGSTPYEASSGWWSVSPNTAEQPIITYDKSKVRSTGQAVVDMSQAPNPTSPTNAISKIFYRNAIGFVKTKKIYLNLWVYTDHSKNPLNNLIDTQSKFMHISNNIFSSNFSSFPYIQASFWEDVRPNYNQLRTSMYTNAVISSDAAQLTANNSDLSSRPIVEAEGWHNVEMEINQGTVDTANGSMTIRIAGPGYNNYGTRSQTGKIMVGTAPTWLSGTSYTVGKAVWYNGTRYTCMTGLTSTTSPDLDQTHWAKSANHDYLDAITFWIWAQKRSSNAWSSTRQYYAGSKADYNGKAYICISDVMSASTPDIDTVHWQKKFDQVWPASTTKWYLDSIYLDNSFARVEVCDSSTWSARAHCEMQPASTWSEGTITSTLTSGNFTPGQSVYLYVVSEDGTVNSSGYKMQLGPTPPKNLKGTVK
jgi:hypothetical protein